MTFSIGIFSWLVLLVLSIVTISVTAAAAQAETQQGQTQEAQTEGGTIKAEPNIDPNVDQHAHGQSYFYLPEGKTRTFVVNAPVHQVIMVSYEVSGSRASPCLLEFRGTDDYVKFTKHVGIQKEESKGQISYLTQEAGEHGFSIRCGATSWWESSPKHRWSLGIEVVADTSSFLIRQGGLGDVPDLNGVVKGIVEMESKIEGIVAENEYEKQQQEMFSLTSEQTLQSVTYLNIFMIVMILATSYYQVIHLKAYFRRQKLI